MSYETRQPKLDDFQLAGAAKLIALPFAATRGLLRTYRFVSRNSHRSVLTQARMRGIQHMSVQTNVPDTGL